MSQSTKDAIELALLTALTPESMKLRKGEEIVLPLGKGSERGSDKYLVRRIK